MTVGRSVDIYIHTYISREGAALLSFLHFTFIFNEYFFTLLYFTLLGYLLFPCVFLFLDGWVHGDGDGGGGGGGECVYIYLEKGGERLTKACRRG